MITSKQLWKMQKEEAIKRLEWWTERGLDKRVLNRFKRGQLMYSDKNIMNGEPTAKLYPFTENGATRLWWDYKRMLETRHEFYVYHIIHDWFDDLEVVLYLYVTKYIFEWEFEREDLDNGLPLVFGLDVRNPHESEFGNIETVISNGGIITI